MEIDDILGIDPYPGSLNAALARDFSWEHGYLTGQIHDVLDRGKGFDSPWGLKWCRFYPVQINWHDAYVMRFELDNYPKNFVEIIADVKLRNDAQEYVAIMKR